jgi:RHH-type proline utilization regulon transcriptional repressor/proline dehydrogenase/delta 1-pyrroline-5-carboxylate dehydrogenase
MKFAELLLEAGLPPAAFTLLPGDGALGARIVSHPDVSGVAFTGSTDAARSINRSLAAKDGPIVPLIAETGGMNAMIVDSSALPEQAVDDALFSAFGSAGQRCSALRVLYVQEEIADKVIAMIAGALKERVIGDPSRMETDIGPVIDTDALSMLEAHAEKMTREGKLVARARIHPDSEGKGTFFAPAVFEIGHIAQLEREVFGPVLHVIRFKSGDMDRVIADINATGYGLTFGLHTRIESVMGRVTDAVHAGNAYVNRTMIGAVVGVQPFGGHGLSGTGPKAGGPHYLPRFATEKVVSTDTTRQGGNASLVTLTET